MSQIKTESISSRNNLTGSPNIDLGDDGDVTVNGTLISDRVKSGSSNLLYSFKSRTAATVISVPSWATDIEIDFYAFKATTAAAYYSTISPILKNGIVFSDFRLTYETVNANQSYAINSSASGRWGSASGSSSVSTMYLLANSASTQFTYSGTIRFKKVLFQNNVNQTNNIYYVTMDSLYSASSANGVVRYSGLFYGSGNDSTDVITEVQFGTNSANDTHDGGFVARFREEDPGTLVD
jgi:hypothetical protein